MNLSKGGSGTSPISHFKSSLIESRSNFMHTELHKIMMDALHWLESKGIHGVITETVTTLKEDAQIGRKSVTHREGRAFDLRTRDWPRELIKEFETHFNAKFGRMGAVGQLTLQPTLLVWHDVGHGEHFHIQLSKTYAMKIPKDMDTQKIA